MCPGLAHGGEARGVFEDAWNYTDKPCEHLLIRLRPDVDHMFWRSECI